MANNTTSHGIVECSVFDSPDYMIVAIISSSSACFSAICSTTLIGLIFLLKKYSFFIQRLVLYLSLAALVNSLSIVLRLYRIGYRRRSEFLDKLCIAAAFIDQTSQWSLFLAFAAVTFTLLMAVVFHKSTVRLERLYIVTIVGLPLTFNWLPFLHGTYGRAGAWCWIRNLNYDDNCSEHRFGTILQFAIWYIPAYVLIGILLITYLAIIAFVVRQKCSRSNRDNEETKKLHEEVWPLLFHPIGLFILNIFPLTNRIYGTLISEDNPIYGLWILHAIFSPLQGGYIALVYILDRATLRQLTCNKFRTLFKNSSDVVRDYPAISGGPSDSVNGSPKPAKKQNLDTDTVVKIATTGASTSQIVL